MINSDNIALYKQAKVENIVVADTTVAIRQFGQGETIIFIHGFPTNGYTWRHLLPILSLYYRCITLDLPGLGDSTWTSSTDFSSSAQAGYVIEVLNKKGIHAFSLVAHNSGATVARIIAVNEPARVKNLVIFNTEIPNHRPPWIPFYQKAGLLPLVPDLIRTLLKQKWFIRSSMGFSEAYFDKSMLNDPGNIQYYLTPFINSKEKAIGAFKYLKGIDWKAIDDFKTAHKKIKANVLMIWGEKDNTFPSRLALKMRNQFNANCKFYTVKDASLLPHEESPEEVCNTMIAFLSNKFPAKPESRP
ncbi:MAG TPA: alpha/beta hydrolase [Parafilimonas sp.]|nr:alpha/beta hydrolase [Parafilimonas sp.]